MPDNQTLLELFTRYERIEANFPGIRREVAGNVIRHVSPGENRGFIAYFNLTSETVEAAIDAQISYFRQQRMDFEWKVYDYDQPPDLKERLAARGFEIEDSEALLVLDLEDAPAVLNHPIPVGIRRITRPEDVDAVVQVQSQVWQEDYTAHGERLKRDLASDPEHVSVFAAFAGEKPVSSAWIYYDPTGPFCGIWGGSTLPEYRKQGWYTALLAVRLQEAHQRGYRYVTIDASPMSRPIVQKYGFRLLGSSTPCVMKFADPDPSSSAARLQE